MNATEKSLRNNDRTATNLEPFSTQQLNALSQQRNSWTWCPLCSQSKVIKGEQSVKGQESRKGSRVEKRKQWGKEARSPAVQWSSLVRRLKQTAVIKEERWTSGVASSRRKIYQRKGTRARKGSQSVKRSSPVKQPSQKTQADSGHQRREMD
jgi:hypothetical protein